MRSALRLLAAMVVTAGLLPATAAATHVPDQSFKMDELFTSPNRATNSDLAFWGNHAFSGYYTADAGFPAGTPPRGGVRIFDVSNPAAPRLIKNVQCDGLQADPIVWDRNGNGVPDLLMLAVDRTMESPDCGAARSNTPAGCIPTPGGPSCVPNHGDPDGWEGVRIFEMSDDPENPFA